MPQCFSDFLTSADRACGKKGRRANRTCVIFRPHSGHVIAICSVQWSYYCYLLCSVAILLLPALFSGHVTATCSVQWPYIATSSVQWPCHCYLFCSVAIYCYLLCSVAIYCYLLCSVAMLLLPVLFSGHFIAICCVQWPYYCRPVHSIHIWTICNILLFDAEKNNCIKKVLLGKLIVPQLVKKFPAVYETRRLITVLTTAASCPYPQTDQSNRPPTNFFKIHLMLSSNLRLCLTTGLFPSGFPTNSCMHLSPYIPHAPSISFLIYKKIKTTILKPSLREVTKSILIRWVDTLLRHML
jgi:hypothetical protein